MLEELRKKPKSVRSLYAFWGAAGITSVIAGIWVLFLVINFDQFEGLNIEPTEQTAGAISQYLSRARERFNLDEEMETEQQGGAETPAPDPSANLPTATATSSPQRDNYAAIIIATSSAESIRISTSTRP